MGEHREYKFRITYFKASGKFYTGCDVIWEVRSCEGGHPYMADATAKIRGLRDNGWQGALPGLCGDGWEGFILVDCDEGYPCLVVPR